MLEVYCVDGPAKGRVIKLLNFKPVTIDATEYKIKTLGICIPGLYRVYADVAVSTDEPINTQEVPTNLWKAELYPQTVAHIAKQAKVVDPGGRMPMFTGELPVE